MKIHKKTTKEEVFECDTCGKTSLWESNIRECEEQHACAHKLYTYDFVTASEENWWFNVNGVDKTCTECGNVLGAVELEDATENQLKLIYEILESNQESK